MYDTICTKITVMWAQIYSCVYILTSFVSVLWWAQLKRCSSGQEALPHQRNRGRPVTCSDYRACLPMSCSALSLPTWPVHLRNMNPLWQKSLEARFPGYCGPGQLDHTAWSFAAGRTSVLSAPLRVSWDSSCFLVTCHQCSQHLCWQWSPPRCYSSWQCCRGIHVDHSFWEYWRIALGVGGWKVVYLGQIQVWLLNT